MRHESSETEADTNDKEKRTQSHTYVTLGGPLTAECHRNEIELNDLINQRVDGDEASFWSSERQPIVGGINTQSLEAMINRMHTLPGCRVCAQLYADVRILLLAIYKSQERTLKIMENRLEEDEEANEQCCCCTINFR